MLVPCGRPGRSFKVLMLKYGLLMDLFNKRQKAGKIEMRQKHEPYLSRRPALSGWLERLSVRQRLHLSQEQFLFLSVVAGLELRLLE